MKLLVSMRFAPYADESPRLLVRNSIETIDREGTFFDTYARDVWLAGGRNATIQLGHDGPVIGQVVIAVPHDQWWLADAVVESDDADVLERVKAGTAVSLGARVLSRDIDTDLRLRRFKLCQLEHIAIARRGQHPGYPGARRSSPSRNGRRSRRRVLPTGAASSPPATPASQTLARTPP